MTAPGPTLRPPDLDALAEIAIEAGLADPDRRPLLLADLPARQRADLPVERRPSAQLRSDVAQLWRLRLADGRSGLASWLGHARAIAYGSPLAARLDRFVAAAARVPPDAVDAFEHVDRDARPLEEHLTRIDVGARGGPASQLFNPKAGIVPFDAELQPGAWSTLTAWCDAPDSVESVLLTGPGGSGKTRMAVELARRQRDRGWRTGFLDVDARPSAMGSGTTTTPTLVIVDYAETRPHVVERLWRLAAADGLSLKLLFLGRTRGDWWADADGLGAATGVAARTMHVHLSPAVVTPTLRERLFDAALDALRPHVPDAADGPSRPRLDEDGWGRPLMIALAAFARLRRRAVDGPDAVLADMVAHERQFWRAALRPTASADAFDAFEHAVAVASLIGARGEALAARLSSATAGRADAAALAARVEAIYPIGEGLTPDLLGETLIAEVLERRPDALDAVIDDETARPALTVLNRIWSRTGRAGDQIRAVVSAAPLSRAPVALEVALAALRQRIEVSDAHPLLASLAEVVDDVAVARIIWPEVPSRSASLTPLRLRALERVHRDAVDRIAPAYLLCWLSTRLADTLNMLGEEERALEVVEAGIARLTDTEEATARWPDLLLAAREKRADILSNLGRWEEATRIVTDAVDRQRGDAEVDRRARVQLAGSLVILGNRLALRGRAAEGMHHLQEAVSIWRPLADEQPALYDADLIQALYSLSGRLGELGRQDEAIDIAREAVERASSPVGRDPDRFEPLMARALQTLGARLMAANRVEEAVGALTTAVDILRRLARRNPRMFESTLARAVDALATAMASAGRPESGLALAVEAAGAFDRRANRKRSLKGRNRVTTMLNLATRTGEAGDWAEAARMNREAVAILRGWAERKPREVEPDLAAALTNLGISLGASDQDREALAPAEEAVEIARRCADRSPAQHEALLACALTSLSMRLERIGRRAEAIELAAESAALHRQLAARSPHEDNRMLAVGLNNLGSLLVTCNRAAEGIRSLAEALAIRRALATANPDAAQGELADTLTHVSRALRALDRPADAMTATTEALSLRARTFARHPRPHARAVRRTLTEYITVRLALGGDLPWTPALESIWQTQQRSKVDAIPERLLRQRRPMEARVDFVIEAHVPDDLLCLEEETPDPAPAEPEPAVDPAPVADIDSRRVLLVLVAAVALLVLLALVR